MYVICSSKYIICTSMYIHVRPCTSMYVHVCPSMTVEWDGVVCRVSHICDSFRRWKHQFEKASHIFRIVSHIFRIVSHISGLSANFLVLTYQVLVGPGRSWLVLIGLGWSQDTWGWSWKALEHLEHLGTPWNTLFKVVLKCGTLWIGVPHFKI